MPNGYPFTKNYNHIAERFNLTPTENNILCRILSYQESGKICNETAESFAKYINVSRDSVLRGLKNLKKAKLIKVTKYHNRNTYTANEYIIFDSSKMQPLKKDSSKMQLDSSKMQPLEVAKCNTESSKMQHNNIIEDNIIRQQTEPPSLGGGGRYANKEEKKFSKKESEDLNGKPQYTPFD